MFDRVLNRSVVSREYNQIIRTGLRNIFLLSYSETSKTIYTICGDNLRKKIAIFRTHGKVMVLTVVLRRSFKECFRNSKIYFVALFQKDQVSSINSLISMEHLKKKKVSFLSFSSSIIRQKGESQNGCFKKTKHAKFSEKRTCAYQGVRNVSFSKNLADFIFLEHPFWDSYSWLITDVFLFWISEMI